MSTLLTLLFFTPAVSPFFSQSAAPSVALLYVTGAHIRQNNLWRPWIRDAVEFPMIRLWYGNSLKYLDSGELSDQCSPVCCWQTHDTETSCRDDPEGQRRGIGKTTQERAIFNVKKNGQKLFKGRIISKQDYRRFCSFIYFWNNKILKCVAPLSKTNKVKP